MEAILVKRKARKRIKADFTYILYKSGLKIEQKGYIKSSFLRENEEISMIVYTFEGRVVGRVNI